MVTPGKAPLFQQTLKSQGCRERTRSEWASCFYSDRWRADLVSLLSTQVCWLQTVTTHVCRDMQFYHQFSESRDNVLLIFRCPNHSTWCFTLSSPSLLNSTLSFHRDLMRILFCVECVECCDGEKMHRYNPHPKKFPDLIKEI